MFDLNEIFDKLTSYIRMCGSFRYVVRKYFFGKSGRGDTPDIFKNFNLNTYPSWPQTLPFECREVRKRKNEQYPYCPFYARISL